MVKALKQSGKDVPDDLKQMADDFLNKVKDGKAKATSLGFGGKGIEKIDEARDLERSALRKQYRTGDEPAEEDKAKEKKEDEIIIHSASEKPAAQPKQPSTLDLLDPTKIKVHKREEPPPSSDPLERARQAASSIGGRLTRPNALRPGQSVDNRGPDAGAYHATLEINDHPQKARWAVTNRTNVAKILEQTGVSITSKGVYYGTGKEPGVGDLPKLYLLVEGDTEAVVMTAMRELMRLLREGTLAAMESEARYGRTSTRYDVV
jgi:ATP-dependent RNA helicase DDX46/PRP5